MSNYANAQLNRTSFKGGSQRVTLAAGVAQGTAQGCKFCRVQCDSANSAVVRVRIGTAATATTGVELPDSPVLTPYSIDDISLLYFYSTDVNAIVDIEYFN
jgi:hypothetical protein